MKSRESAVKLVMKLLDSPAGGDKMQGHFGKQELKILFDFIYEGPPKSDAEKIPKMEPLTGKY